MNEAMAPFESTAHYQALRRALCMFFERRSPRYAEEQADECVRRLLAHVAAKGMPDDVNKFAMGIAKKLYLEWCRKSARLPEAAAEEIPQPAPSPRADHARLAAASAVRELSAEERELLEAYFIDGKTAIVLSRKAGLSPEGVRSKVFRLRRKVVASFLAQTKGRGR
jgi:RNA polymerase sigma factor (sigma-70 family)